MFTPKKNREPEPTVDLPVYTPYGARLNQFHENMVMMIDKKRRNTIHNMNVSCPLKNVNTVIFNTR
jgi:hypothetical protein